MGHLGFGFNFRSQANGKSHPCNEYQCDFTDLGQIWSVWKTPSIGMYPSLGQIRLILGNTGKTFNLSAWTVH